MDETLEEGLGALGLRERVPTLEQADLRAQETVGEARSVLVDRLGDQLPTDILICGAVARRDALPHRDVDYLIVTHGTLAGPRDLVEVLDAVEEVREKLYLQPSGRSAGTGRVVSAADLIERIGLEDDTEVTRASRVRVLAESVSVYRPDLRDELLAGLARRYLGEYDRGKHGVPRPLVNDVLWYWRALTLVQQAKRWGGTDAEWGPRYLDLIVSRKLAIAGTLASLFRCEVFSPEYLVAEAARTPLARLVALHPLLDAPAHRAELRRVIEIAEETTVALGHDAFLGTARQIRSRRDIDRYPPYRRMILRARELQAALEALFFDTPVLAERSRKYLAF